MIPKPLDRRRFLEHSTVVLGALTALRSAEAQPPKTDEASTDSTPPTHPLLTPADKFGTVARGEPKPHTLVGDALAAARLTAETWRLEITADPFVEPPRVSLPAEIGKSFTLADGTALDLPKLKELGRTHGVKYIKAMQCLNIQTPLGQGLWEGVPLREVLRLCGPVKNVRRIYYWGFHNHDPKQVFKSSVSYTQAMETPPGDMPAFLAYRLNGEDILPLRGGPVRMLIPWSHGFKSVKWLQHIFLTNDYRINDTYASQNNDPDSGLKTAAYVDSGRKKFVAGARIVASGQVISGISGVERVEYWVRPVDEASPPLADDDPELLRGPWTACKLDPPPDDWSTVLPPDVNARQLLGFDPHRGKPVSWPLRYGMASWNAVLAGLSAGTYEFRARAVDRNGFAQPEPRPQQKSGKNGIQVWKFDII